MPAIAIGLNQDAFKPEQLEELKTLSAAYDVLFGREEKEINQHREAIEIAFHLPQAQVASLPNLRWFQQWGAGADWLQRYPELKNSKLIITKASGVHPVQITEHVFALLLAFARQLPKSFATQQKSHWRKFSHDEVFELADKTMLILGVGAIGERIARVAQAFGMKLFGIKRQAKPVAGIERMLAPADLHRVLPEADVVVITLPLTPETRNFISRKELELMKADACLINIGRGGLIDEDALLNVLKQGKLRGVGLDVFEQEPLASTSPLWQQERVIITSHYAGLSPNYHKRVIRLFLENLKRYRAKEALLNVVDKTLGY